MGQYMIRSLSFVLIALVPVWAQPVNPSTPCIEDFEDFIPFVSNFNTRSGDPAFRPVHDLNGDGRITFSDFILFASGFNQNICVDIDSVLVKEQVRIEQLIADGIPQRQTEIGLRFSVPLRSVRDKQSDELIHQQGLSIKTSVIDLGTGENALRSLDIQKVNRLTLSVNGLVSGGSILSTDLWTMLVLNAYKTLSGSVELPASLSIAEATLGLRPFRPENMNLFTIGAYPDAAMLSPASGSEMGEAEAQSALASFLNMRFAGDADQADRVRQALDVFSGAATRAKISNPALRAGLVSLTGTLAEPAIQAIVNRSEVIAFGTVVSGDYAELQEQVFGGRQAVFDERYRSEAFALFGPVFARLALQEDFATGQEEELIGAAVLSLVAMQQALVDSLLALSGSELSRRLNTQMLARLNSGRAAFPGVGIYQAPDGEIFPGGTKFESFAAVFAPLPSQETQAGSVLKAYLERLVPEGVNVPEFPGFDLQTLDFLDRYQNVLTAEAVVRVARILKLRFRD